MTSRTIALRGQGVSLAEMMLVDQPFFHEWLQNKELRDLIDDPRIPTIRDQTLWFERVQKPDRRFFSLVTTDGTLIGNGGFVDIDPNLREATLRITIGNPMFWGQGLGSEAVRLLLHYGFEQASFRKIKLDVLKTNERAIRSYEKAGFKITSERLQDGKTIFTMTIDAP